MTTRFTMKLAAAIVAAFSLQGQSAGMGQYSIDDPVLQMRAWTLTAPAGWTVAGTMLPPPSCSTGTSPVYKAVSPDGNTGVYLLPRADWAWGAGVRPATDCLPFGQEVSAKAYLTYLTRVLHVAFVSEEPIPNLDQMRANFQHGTLDSALYIARYSVNGKAMGEYLSATVTCSQGVVMGLGTQHHCSAFTKRSFAPLAKLKAMRPTFDAMAMQLNPQWMQAWQAAMTSSIERRSQQQTQAMLYQGELAQRQRTLAHQDFMASMQGEAAQRTSNFEATEYQKQNNKENYVDYILDCQRYSGEGQRVAVGNCPVRETP